ncbi:AMP-binding protein [Paenibacillus rhizoplanae]
MKQLFETQAALREEAVAVVCGNERITYKELNNRSNQLAHHLRKYGVGCESLVAIMLDKSIEAIIAILGGNQGWRSLYAGGFDLSPGADGVYFWKTAKSGI